MAVATITELKMLIGGEWVESSSGEWMDVRSPATGEVVGRVPKGHGCRRRSRGQGRPRGLRRRPLPRSLAARSASPS